MAADDRQPLTESWVDETIHVAEEVRAVLGARLIRCIVRLLTASALSQFQARNADDSAIEDAESSTASIASSILDYRTIHGRTYHSNRSVNSKAQPYWYIYPTIHPTMSGMPRLTKAARGAKDDKQNYNLDLV